MDLNPEIHRQIMMVIEHFETLARQFSQEIERRAAEGDDSAEVETLQRLRVLAERGAERARQALLPE